MSAKIKICMIGCGKTATKHASSLVDCGFEITHVLNNNNKKRIIEFAKKFKVKNIIEKKNHFFTKNFKVDAFVVVVPPKNLEEYTKRIINLKKPALVEKPLSLNVGFLNKYKNNKLIMVGFNKRYYKSILEAKKFVKGRKKYSANIVLPESINYFNYKNKKKFILTKHFSNSVHVFDILNWIFGKVILIRKNVVKSKNKIHGYICLFKDSKNNYINFYSPWNSPENYSISINDGKFLYKISPLEVAKIFNGFDIRLTKKNTKKYIPKEIKYIEDEKSSFANGFFLQAKLFSKFCKKNKKIDIPLIKDAYKAQKIANSLVYK